MRLCQASATDSEWLRQVFERISRPFGSRISAQPGGTLTLHPPAADPGPRIR